MAAQSELTDSLIYGIDLKNRRIYFGVPIDWSQDDQGDFTQASVELAIRSMHRMALDAPGKPIEIHMNSYGGDMYAMLRLHDEILSCPCQVKFYGGGAIMSAATWIMAVCDERYLYPHASVMVHELSSWYEGKHTDIQIGAVENQRLMAIAYDIYEKNSRMPRDFWVDVLQRDLFLSASEAVSLGLADKIIEPKKRGNLRKMRQAAMKKAPEAGEMKKLLADIYARINKVKVPKLELNPVVKEPSDPHVVVDDKPAETEKPQQVNAEASQPKDPAST
jgi:ATP-dependent protease ClpP protease subunit